MSSKVVKWFIRQASFRKTADKPECSDKPNCDTVVEPQKKRAFPRLSLRKKKRKISLDSPENSDKSQSEEFEFDKSLEKSPGYEHHPLVMEELALKMEHFSDTISNHSSDGDNFSDDDVVSVKEVISPSDQSEKLPKSTDIISENNKSPNILSSSQYGIYDNVVFSSPKTEYPDKISNTSRTPLSQTESKPTYSPENSSVVESAEAKLTDHIVDTNLSESTTEKSKEENLEEKPCSKSSSQDNIAVFDEDGDISATKSDNFFIAESEKIISNSVKQIKKLNIFKKSDKKVKFADRHKIFPRSKKKPDQSKQNVTIIITEPSPERTISDDKIDIDKDIDTSEEPISDENTESRKPIENHKKIINGNISVNDEPSNSSDTCENDQAKESNDISPKQKSSFNCSALNNDLGREISDKSYINNKQNEDKISQRKGTLNSGKLSSFYQKYALKYEKSGSSVDKSKAINKSEASTDNVVTTNDKSIISKPENFSENLDSTCDKSVSNSLDKINCEIKDVQNSLQKGSFKEIDDTESDSLSHKPDKSVNINTEEKKLKNVSHQSPYQKFTSRYHKYLLKGDKMQMQNDPKNSEYSTNNKSDTFLKENKLNKEDTLNHNKEISKEVVNLSKEKEIVKYIEYKAKDNADHMEDAFSDATDGEYEKELERVFAKHKELEISDSNFSDSTEETEEQCDKEFKVNRLLIKKQDNACKIEDKSSIVGKRNNKVIENRPKILENVKRKKSKDLNAESKEELNKKIVKKLTIKDNTEVNFNLKDNTTNVLSVKPPSDEKLEIKESPHLSETTEVHKKDENPCLTDKYSIYLNKARNKKDEDISIETKSKKVETKIEETELTSNHKASDEKIYSRPSKDEKPVLEESVDPVSSHEKYPEDLNPFGEEESEAANKLPVNGYSGNPFGSDCEENDSKEAQHSIKIEQTNKSSSHPQMKPCQRKFLSIDTSNPFGEYDDLEEEEEEESLSPSNPFNDNPLTSNTKPPISPKPVLPPKTESRRGSLTPVPHPRKSKQKHYGSSTSLCTPVPYPRSIIPESNTDPFIRGRLGRTEDSFFERDSSRISLPLSAKVKLPKKKRSAPLPPDMVKRNEMRSRSASISPDGRMKYAPPRPPPPKVRDLQEPKIKEKTLRIM